MKGDKRNICTSEDNVTSTEKLTPLQIETIIRYTNLNVQIKVLKIMQIETPTFGCGDHSESNSI